MDLSKEKMEEVFSEGEKLLKEFALPAWDDFPNIELYMDQVVALLNDYLSIFSAPKGDMQITSTMINNYVKLKTIPAPVKKKYSKKHLAYLVMVCILKQAHSMSTISSLIPPNLEEEELKKIYASFVTNHQKAYSYVTDQIYNVATRVMSEESGSGNRINDLVLQVAVSANIFKLVTDWVTTKTDTALSTK